MRNNKKMDITKKILTGSFLPEEETLGVIVFFGINDV